MKKIFLLIPFFAILIFSSMAKEAKGTEVTVFHSKHCGCCKKWMAHLERDGFKVISKEVADVNSVKTNLKVPGSLSSCHTAVVGGYIVEGHVPVEAIKKLLASRPQVKGIGVPGMPMGSPGMEGPYSERYSVNSFQENGGNSFFMQF